MTTTHTSGAADLPETLDAIADSQYLAGVTAGWNAAQANDPNAALRKIHESRAGYLKPLRDAQLAALAAGQAVAPAEPPKPPPVSLYREACATGERCLHGCHKTEPCHSATRPAPPAMDGEVVVTTDQQGRCVAVTRQDDEGRVLKIIWQAMDGGDAEDAKRYRWLRDDGVPNRSGERPWAVVRDGKGYAWCMGGALDERIDAARAAQKEGKKP